MTFFFIAMHDVDPAQQEAVLARMRELARSLQGTPGLLEIAPYREVGGTRLVGLSRWQSRSAFEAAMPGSGVPSSVIHPGETRPREYLHLSDDVPA